MNNRNKMLVIVLIICSVARECYSCFAYHQAHQPRIIKTGSAFYQPCHCLEAGDSPDSIMWIDPRGKVVEPWGPGTIGKVFTERQPRSVSLNIPHMSKSIAGKYKCVTMHEGQTFISQFPIEAYDPLYFVNTADNQFITMGKESYVTCQARGETEPLIKWYKGDEDIVEITNDAKYTIEADRLKISHVVDDDNGTYKCTALVMKTGEAVDKNIKVEVLYLPYIEDIRVEPNNKTVIVGDNVVIECLASGKPHPEYSFSKTSEKVALENVTWVQEVNTIAFNNIQSTDRGTYQCKASNRAGETTQKVTIEVFVPPEINDFANKTVIEGSTVQIICKAEGRPVPHLTIEFLGEYDFKDTNSSVVYEYLKTSETSSMFVITFLQIDRLHAGKYVCNASNDVDMVSEEMGVTILHKPYYTSGDELLWGWKEKVVNISCENQSNPPGNITLVYQQNQLKDLQKKIYFVLNDSVPYITLNIDENTLYGLYECTASNDFGLSKKKVHLMEGFVPPTINNVTIIEITASSVTFEFNGPDFVMGPPLIGYTAEYNDLDTYKMTNTHKHRTWAVNIPYKVSKLRPETDYLFKFAAINAVGIGVWTEALELVTLERTVPEAPTMLEEVRKSSDTEQVLKWQTPEYDDDGPVDYYFVKYCPMKDKQVSEELCEVVISSVAELDLDHLDRGTNYYIELLAHNSRGNSSVTSLNITTSHLQSAHEPVTTISGSAIIGLSVLVVVTCILSFDLILFCWRKQGLIANCYYKKKRKEEKALARDKKGLLKDGNPSAVENTMKDGHKEFEYNKTTGVITGKHSSV